MGFIFFGTKEAAIGIDEQLVYCPSCEADAFADIMVMSTYFHMYYLPLFPVSKEVNVICKTCGLKRYGSPLNSGIIKNYAEIKHQFKHPWYTFVFPGLVVFLIIMAIVYK